jgi:outer membrane receptor protein involved in Fe transport
VIAFNQFHRAASIESRAGREAGGASHAGLQDRLEPAENRTRYASLSLMFRLAGALLLAAAPTPAGVAASLSGRVADETGKPVPAAQVVLRNAAQAVVAATSSGETGQFRFDSLPTGSYLLQATAPGFAEWSSPVRLVAGRDLDVSIGLSLSPVRSEITVSAEAGRVERVEDVPQRISVLDREEAAERAVTVLTETADGDAGVVQMRTAPAMGSFMIRGLTGKGVAVYRDGVRYTTSAQRGGVNTFQNLVDASTLDGIEFLRGPNSAQFGSDSLGGAVNLLSRAPALASGGAQLRGDASTFYNSAAHAFGSQATTAWSGERAGLVASLHAKRVNTTRTGGGIDSHAAVTRFLGLPSNILGGRLPDTAFTQYGGSLHAQVQLAPLHHLAAHYERGQQDGAKRYDQLLGGDGNLIADLRNLMLDFGYLRYQGYRAGPFDQLWVSGSYNAQREERVNQGGNGNPNGAITHQYERLRAWGVQAQAERRLGAHALLAGGESYFERIAAPAFTFDPVRLTTAASRPRVPDNAGYRNWGVFAQDAFEALGGRLRVSGALRYGGAFYRSRASDSPVVSGRTLWPDDSLAAHALSGRAGAVVRATGWLRLYGNYSRGFRAPAMTDLGTLGLQGNGFYEASASAIQGRQGIVGDSADANAKSTGVAVAPVRPETSDNFDGGFAVAAGNVHLEATAFYLRLGNTIVSQTLLLPPGAVGSPLGDQVISAQLPSGAVFVPISSNPVLVRANYGGARLKGVEQSLRVKLTRALTLVENFTWIEARDAVTGLPPDIEPGVPGPVVNGRLLYSPAPRRFWAEVYAMAMDRQSRLSSLALSDRRIGATRSRSNIQNFFNNGARVRGLVRDGRLLATGETLAEVQARVLGAASSAPLFREIPGWASLGMRLGVPTGEKSELLLDLSNAFDKNYRGIGWGIDAPGRAITLRWKLRF